jgi:hypothetical protein
MKRSDFDSTDAYEIYANYIEQVNGIISMLHKEDILDIVNEIDSHIYESFLANKAILQEDERITAVLRNLGEPLSYLMPLIAEVIAEGQLKQPVSKYDIPGILRGIRAALRTGGKYVITSILYLLIVSCGLLAVAKIFYPRTTGLFIADGNFAGFGYLSQINAGAIELLGYWMIPAMIASCVIFYLLNLFITRPDTDSH